jgi:uncharacterized membrane protein
MNMMLYLYIGGGLLLTGLSIPLILRKVKPNYWYGFRVKATLEDPVIWYEVNAYAGRRLMVVGLLTVVAATGLYFTPNLSLDSYALGCMAVSVGGLTLTLIQSARYLKSFKKQ